MSETTTRTPVAPSAAAPRSDRRRRLLGALVLAVVVVVLLALPLYINEFWLRTGFAVCGAAVGAIG
ncbi:MAG: branched-chain amino acid ABC transporter permease, partial [Blastococcus sp.]